MKSNRYMRGPSAIEPAGGQEEERTVRAVASEEKEDQREVRSDAGASERAVQSSCACEGDGPTKKSKPKARRASNLYKTICDWDLSKKDKDPLRAYSGSSKWLTVVGTGKPKVVPLNPSLISKLGPCELEVYAKHEDVHVQNAKANCAAFKTCVEGHYGLISKTVYYNDYVGCYNKHHGGMHANCRQDEMQAYAASAALASKLSKQKRCSSEQSRLQSVAAGHAKWAVTPPNC
jgi:hypothetical protein